MRWNYDGSTGNNRLKLYGYSNNDQHGPFLSIRRDYGGLDIKSNSVGLDMTLRDYSGHTVFQIDPISSKVGALQFAEGGTSKFQLRYTSGYLAVWDWGANKDVLTIKDGKVGILDTSPTNALDVKGTIRAYEIKVDTGWSDFVFDDDYDLMPLERVEEYVTVHNHLPDIPSAEFVHKNGVSLGESQSKLLQKIEELTLYIIEQNKKLRNQNERLIEQNNRIETLETYISSQQSF